MPVLCNLQYPYIFKIYKSQSFLQTISASLFLFNFQPVFSYGLELERNMDILCKCPYSKFKEVSNQDLSYKSSQAIASFLPFNVQSVFSYGLSSREKMLILCKFSYTFETNQSESYLQILTNNWFLPLIQRLAGFWLWIENLKERCQF